MEAATGGSASSHSKYHLLTSLGRGGMAEVFLAAVAGPGAFNKLLVVKLLRTEAYRSGAELDRMFLDEARLSARLNHPNIVQTYEVGELFGRYFIAMEYLEGQTLREVQRRLRGPLLPLGEALRVIAKTARGLHYAHELKDFDGKSLEVVHRDVSPHNVFVTYDGQVKLLDFGIAKARDSENFTKAGVVKGKLDYIAPEQLRGDKVDRRADVFSLGVMAWELIAGVRYAGGADVDEAAKYQRRLQGQAPKLRFWKRDVPEQLEVIVERALALDPAHRYQTAAEFADALESFLEHAGLRVRGSDLGERVAKAFAAERAQLAASIERELTSLRILDAGRSRLARLGLERLLACLPGRSTRAREREAGRAAPPSGVTSDLVELSTTSFDIATTSALSFTTAREHRAAGRLRISRLAACTAIGAAAAALLWTVPQPSFQAHRSSSDRVPVRAPPPRAVRLESPQAEHAPVRPEAPNAPATLRLEIEVQPQDADAKLDGAALPSLPFFAELRRDGSTHYLEASAAGYVSKRVVVPFDHDRVVKIELQKRPSRATRARAQRAPVPSVGASQEPGVGSPSDARTALRKFEPGEPIGLDPRRGTVIDTRDPYAL